MADAAAETPAVDEPITLVIDNADDVLRWARDADPLSQRDRRIAEEISQAISNHVWIGDQMAAGAKLFHVVLRDDGAHTLAVAKLD